MTRPPSSPMILRNGRPSPQPDPEYELMATIQSLKEKYESLDRRIATQGEEAVDAECLMAFEYEHPDQPAQVSIDTDEFSALCPWTGLPDLGALAIIYTPANLCVELKSLKYYFLSYRDVGIVQEHAANRILNDLVLLCQPRWMKVVLDYKVRGGLHTTVSVEYPQVQPPTSGQPLE